MAILTIGRVGLDVELNHPSEMSESRSVDSREFTLRGFLRSSSLTLTNYLRDELLEQQGQIVAVTYTLDSHYDAFYLLSDSRIESMETSYLRRGLWLFEVTLFRIGGQARTEFSSNLTGTVLENTVGLVESETTPPVAPPVGSSVFRWDVGTFNVASRVTEDGTITVYSSAGIFTEDASWGCSPANFYKAAAKLYVTGRLRAGLDVPQDPTDWQIDNSFIRIKPNVTADELEFAIWDGTSAYESVRNWKFQLNAVDLGAFSFMSVIRNDPEAVSIRLQTEGGSAVRHTIDLTLRRGASAAYINWYYSGAAGTLKIVNVTANAGSTLTPPGATGDVGLQATSNDADGNKWVLFTPKAHTNDTTNGGVSVTSANRFNACLGISNGAIGSLPSNLATEYFGMFGERVRAVWR